MIERLKILTPYNMTMEKRTHSEYQNTQIDDALPHNEINIIHTNKRNKTVDLIRAFAAYGVIAIHVPYSTAAAESLNTFFSPLCVPFFYIVSLGFFISSLHPVAIHNIFAKTWRRVLIPYLAWTIIYAGLIIIKKRLIGEDNDLILWKVLFYGEGAVQLYFLPTLVMIQFTALAIFLVVTPSFKKQYLGFIILIIVLLYMIWGDLNDCYGVANTGQIVGITSYIIFAFWLSRKPKKWVIQPKYIVTGILLVMLAVLLNFSGYTLTVLNYSLISPLGGIGLLLFAVGIPTSTLPSWLSNLSSASFGIYLCHVLFLEAFEFVVEKIFSISINYNLASKITEVTLIFVLSAILTFFLRKIPVCKKVLLGE